MSRRYHILNNITFLKDKQKQQYYHVGVPISLFPSENSWEVEVSLSRSYIQYQYPKEHKEGKN